MNTHLLKPMRYLTIALASVFLSASVVSAGPAQFVIVNLNPPGVGFNDPTPVTPVGGNPGTTLGEQRLIAFDHAAKIWSARLGQQRADPDSGSIHVARSRRTGKCRTG